MYGVTLKFFEGVRNGASKQHLVGMCEVISLGKLRGKKYMMDEVVHILA